MPAYDAAILIHCEHPDFDPALAAAVRAETFLAVTACSPRIEQGKQEIYIPALEDYLTVYSPGRLHWDLTAHVLQWNGLADQHPGTAFSRRLLTSANAAWRLPFQRSAGGTLTYENPRPVQDGGTLPLLTFTIAEVMGGSLDASSFPGSSAVSYYDLSPQDPVPLPAAARTALLQDIFQSTGFYDTDLLCTSYLGDPASGGVAVLTPALSEPWIAVSGDTEITADACPLTLFDPDSGSVACDYFRIHRSTGQLCLDIPVAGGVTIPAGRTFRLPAGALSALLQWVLDGDGSLGTGLAAPSAIALRHLLGDATAGILTGGPTLDITAWDGDPAASGTALDTFPLDRDNLHWLVTGDTASNLGHPAGTNTAPGPGWVVYWLTAALPGVDTWFVKHELPSPYTFTVGQVITLNPGDLVTTIG